MALVTCACGGEAGWGVVFPAPVTGKPAYVKYDPNHRGPLCLRCAWKWAYGGEPKTMQLPLVL